MLQQKSHNQLLTEALQITEVCWNYTGKIVSVQEQDVQVLEVANTFRDGASQLVIIQVQQDEIGKLCSQKIRDGSLKLSTFQAQFLQLG